MKHAQGAQSGPGRCRTPQAQAGAALSREGGAEVVSWAPGAVCRAQRRQEVEQWPHILPMAGGAVGIRGSEAEGGKLTRWAGCSSEIRLYLNPPLSVLPPCSA